jgi:hypothetical protein
MIPLAIIYSNDNIESQRLVALFQTLETRFIEYKLGRDFNEKQFLSEFGQHAEYPQVAVGDKHIGSLKETLQYLTYNKYI